ncbi:myb/SANT-like DNA-binding domain-containing protein 3 isoform X2 [Salarias fasciatus]|uniref:myb/SANT-like DNA-binding domain-containing protein 3 isoform X2 n=1 Tax=Salarias fasciatus TaxID=181472 RepID=UPI0011766976|nr:myb/SANT-like DNA-binding domain-containing protein 3 isoform X2 [Salarias fasciatus]
MYPQGRGWLEPIPAAAGEGGAHPGQLFTGMASRKRRPNWTDEESLLLATLLQDKKDVIRGKSSTGVLPQDRKQAWEEIAKTINDTFPESHRTVLDCNRKWENLLAKAKEEIKRKRRDANQTEVPSLNNFSAVSQIVISVMNFSETLLKDDWIHKPGPDKNEKEHTTNKKVTNRHSVLTNSEGDPEDSCLTSVQSVQCRTLQERRDLEMSVLRRQETVLRLQEEYYTLKLKMMKKQMEESAEKE